MEGLLRGRTDRGFRHTTILFWFLGSFSLWDALKNVRAARAVQHLSAVKVQQRVVETPSETHSVDKFLVMCGRVYVCMYIYASPWYAVRGATPKLCGFFASFIFHFEISQQVARPHRLLPASLCIRSIFGLVEILTPMYTCRCTLCIILFVHT